MSKQRRSTYSKARWLRVTQLMARDGSRCSLCARELSRKVKDPAHPDYITFDHVVPRSRGGLDNVDNLRLAHQACNRRRGNDPILPAEEHVR